MRGTAGGARNETNRSPQQSAARALTHWRAAANHPSAIRTFRFFDVSPPGRFASSLDVSPSRRSFSAHRLCRPSVFAVVRNFWSAKRSEAKRFGSKTPRLVLRNVLRAKRQRGETPVIPSAVTFHRSASYVISQRLPLQARLLSSFRLRDASVAAVVDNVIITITVSVRIIRVRIICQLSARDSLQNFISVNKHTNMHYMCVKTSHQKICSFPMFNIYSFIRMKSIVSRHRI